MEQAVYADFLSAQLFDCRWAGALQIVFGAKPWQIGHGFVMSGALVRLLAVAADQHGLFTVGQAATVGVGDDQVRRMAATGVLERRAQGSIESLRSPSTSTPS